MSRQATPTLAERYAAWILKWRWAVIAVTLIVAGGLAAGAGRLAFDNSYRVFFGKDNPQLLAFEALENTYAKNDNVLFVLAPESGHVFTPEFMEVVADLTDRAWQLPYARRVDSPTNFQHSRAEEDDLIVADLVADPAGSSEAELAAALEIALAEPALAQRLVTEQASVTGVNVTLELPGDSPFEVTEAALAAQELAAALESENPGLIVHLTGVAMLNHAFADHSAKDMQNLVPIMFGAMIVVAFLFLRSISGAMVTLLIIMLSTVSGMGTAGWLGIKLTPPSSVAPTMIMTLAVADSIHVLVTMLAAMRAGMGKRDALIESLRVNMMPIVITSLTTAIGFLSLNFSDAPPFRDLGNISAMGVTFALFYSVTLLPALMAVLPVRKRKEGNETAWNLGWLAGLQQRRSRPLMWGSILVVIAIVSFVPRNELNDQFVQYFEKGVEFREATDFTNQNLTGIYNVDFDLKGNGPGGISDPAYLRTLDEFESWMRQQPGVLQVNSLSHVIKRLNRNMHGDDPAMQRIPDSRELAAQYLLLYEMSLPYGLDLNNQINVDKSASRFSVTLTDLSARQMRNLVHTSEAWLESNAPAGMFSHGIGPAIMFAYISERNVKSMVLGTLVALVLISACLIFALRSLRYGILSLVPNLIPAMLTFGLWGIFVREVNLGLANVMAMSLGIVADDTIHFLSKYLRGRREHGYGADDAVRYAFSSVGKALVVTSVVLITGFAVMTQSVFALNSNMGWFTVIAIFVALTADFMLLPALLLQLDRRRDQKASVDIPAPASVPETV